VGHSSIPLDPQNNYLAVLQLGLLFEFFAFRVHH